MQRIQRHQTKEADQVDQRRQKQTNCCRRQFRQNRYFLQKLRLFMIFPLYLFKQVTIDSTVVVNVMPLLPPQSQEISQSENFHEAIFYVIETLLRQYHPRKKNVRLLDVIHHENIKKLSSIRFLKLNLESRNFVQATFSRKPRPLFIYLQFEVASDANNNELRNEVLLNEANLNHINTKVTGVCSFVKKANIQLRSSLIIMF